MDANKSSTITIDTTDTFDIDGMMLITLHDQVRNNYNLYQRIESIIKM